MFGQHHTALSALPSNVFSCILAGLLFALSIWAPLHLWQPLVCGTMEDGSCEFDPTVSLVGVIVAALVHSISVAIFAWSPISAPLRSFDKSTRRPSLFNTFLYASIACDIVAYGHALTSMKGFDGFVQAVTITFNAPFVVFAPYILAAYADPSTDIGSFVHRIKARITEYASDDSEGCSCGESNCVHKTLERAYLISPNTFESRCRHQDDDESYSVEEMRARPNTPRFSLFVTAPTESVQEQYTPLPASLSV